MIKTGKQLANAAIQLACNYKTIYGLGCFGWPMNRANQDRAIGAYVYNAQPARVEKLRSADETTFAFDCVGMIKALLWGWYGNHVQSYGGAVYASNGIPDKNANQMIELCKEVSTDFSRIQPGEVVWMDGHIGIYIDNGLAVECTPRWSDGVQVTAVHNIGTRPDFNGRSWTKHGKLPWLQYDASEVCYTLALPYLRRGSTGPLVETLQKLLQDHGFPCGSKGSDGIFGSATEKSVYQFQKNRNLKVDGIVGPSTMRQLLEVDQL